MPDLQGRLKGRVVNMKIKPAGSPMHLVKAGDSGAVMVKDAQAGLVIESRRFGGVDGRYVYLGLDDSALKKGAVPKVKVTLLYRDKGPATLQVLYDSSDAKHIVAADAPGAWKLAGNLKLDQTGEWRQVSFTLADAYFGGRLNGGDLRVQWGDDLDVEFMGAWVEAAP